MKLLSLALALALALAPQDKITLKFNPKKGDKLQKTEKMEMSMKAKVVAGDQEQEIEFEQRDVQKATLEYAEVADGAVTRSVFDCQEHVEAKKGPPTLQWEKSEKPLHGRKIALSMKDGKLVREGAEGLEEKVLNKLDLADRSSRIFPKNPVAPGDAWELQGDDVRKFLGADNDLKDAKVKVKFLSVKDVDGRKCAILNAVLDLVGKAEGDVDLTVKIDTEVVVWIERGYTLSVKGKGSVTMKAENAQFKLNGQGPMTLEMTSKVE
ncbi:MAG: hypothetical protein HY293_16610 [Planctomycetes bacterium]|nr:hypothetical protein [Planctomycetota bacterium]